MTEYIMNLDTLEFLPRRRAPFTSPLYPSLDRDQVQTSFIIPVHWTLFCFPKWPSKPTRRPEIYSWKRGLIFALKGGTLCYSNLVIKSPLHSPCCRLIRTSGNVAKIFKPLGVTLGASSSQVLSPNTQRLCLGQLLAKPKGVDPNKISLRLFLIMKVENTDFLGVLKWNEFRYYPPITANKITLATLSQIDTQYSRHITKLIYSKNNRINQCQNEESALPMWVASVVSVKVL